MSETKTEPGFAMPFALLARDYKARIRDVYEQRDGVMKFACPVDGADAYLMLGATAGGDAIWCDGECSDQTVSEAVQFVAARLPRLCQSPQLLEFGHERSCLACQNYSHCLAQVARELDVRFRVPAEATEDDEALDWDGDYALDLGPLQVLWGDSLSPLVVAGQPWLIGADDGVGKSTLASRYAVVRARIEGCGTTLLDEPVTSLREDQRVYMLGADRPIQLAQALGRYVTESNRAQVRDRIKIRAGAPKYSLASQAGASWLLRKVERLNAGLVVLDSRKDFGSVLELSEVVAISRLIGQLTLAGIEVLTLSHLNKGRKNGPPSIEDVTGHREVFSGQGSIILLNGRAGATEFDLIHGKPPRDIHKTIRVLHDHASGQLDVSTGIVPTPDRQSLQAGAMPVSRVHNTVKLFMDASGGFATSAALQEHLESTRLYSGNLSRDLRELRDAGLMSWNGLKGDDSGWMWTGA